MNYKSATAKRRTSLLFFAFYFFLFTSQAQAPRSLTSSEILQQIQKLKVLGTVLYLAAHPDDENTRLLAWLANEKKYRTGYLSLTRGDGGQNLIGDEQGIELGLIRTQELLAARRMDGAEQFFSRAYDFGFSKTAEETFKLWDREKILSDAVWVIRKFQPDVIITRFPPDSRAGHGNHTASAMLAIEAFDAAADPTRFPEQFNNRGIQAWKVKRLFWNAFGGNAEGQVITVDAGSYNALLGKSYGEIAAESRTNHKSQGFGSARSRGVASENLTLLKGNLSGNDLMSGVDVSWNRIGAPQIEKSIDSVISHFNPLDPAASVLPLTSIYQRITQLNDTTAYWRDKKLGELKEIILACAGVFVEAVSNKQFVTEGDTLGYTVNCINRSRVPVSITFNQKEAPETFKAKTAETSKGLQYSTQPLPVDFNKNVTIPARRPINAGFMQTQPYWLRLGMYNAGSFNVSEQQLIGMAETEPLSLNISFIIDGHFSFYITRPILYKTVDQVKGEQYNPVIITPKEKIFSNNNLVLFRKGRHNTAQIVLSVTPEETTAEQKVALQLTSKRYTFSKPLAAFKPVSGIGQNFTLRLTNYLQGSGVETDTLMIQLKKDSTKEIYGNAGRTISFEHIPTINYYYRDAIKVLNIDLQTKGKTIGYIPGAGDKVADALRQMGYEVTELTDAMVTPGMLKTFDAVITGVRAYDVHDWLEGKYDILMQYVKAGGNVIVQYNRNNLGRTQTQIGPYPFSIVNKRVSEEDAVVKFVMPAHASLNYPNKITNKDFEGWIQERSTYQAETTDSRYVAPLSMHDTGESDSNGSLLIGKFGKGNFVYAGLVFFRQLPAGVPGAYRLMANLIALGK